LTKIEQMRTNYNRREFVKRSAFAIAGSTVLLSGAPFACSAAASDIVIWDMPGGDF